MAQSINQDRNIIFEVEGTIFKGFAQRQGDGIKVILQDDGLYRIELEKFGLRKWERFDIEYGINGSSWTWNENILTVNHALELQMPLVYVYLRPKTGTPDEQSQLEMAIIPHSFSQGDFNHVKFDFTGFENYYICIRIVG